jgi:HK97 family phage portal protein
MNRIFSGLYSRVRGFAVTVAGAFAGFFDKRLWKSVRGRPTASQEEVNEDTAMTWSGVWCATRLLCGIGASLPLSTYEGKDDDTRTKARKHKLWRLLNVAPNPEMTAFAWRSIMWQWQVNWGNAYAEVVREGNNPDGELVALWPIHPERVSACRDDNGELYYKVENASGQPDTELDAWRMLHIPSIITNDGLMGMGVIEHARETIGAAIGQEKAVGHSVGGGNLPRMVLTHAGHWDDEARKEFRDEFEELYSGSTGHRLAVLQGGAELKPLSFNAVDSQFLEQRQFNLEEIARWYGIPPHLLHHLMRATFNNIEELGINFVQYSLISWLKIWEQCIALKLLSPEEQETHFVEHNVDALLRGDATTRAALYTALINAMVMTRNEARRLENLNPVPGGDTFLAQGAMVPLDEDGRPESTFVNPTKPAPAADGTPDGATPQTAGRQVLANVATRVNRIISHDLSRFLTKETKAMQNYARKPNEFVQLVDAFYTEHATLVLDEMTETFGTLAICGVNTDVDVFVTTWIGEGKSIALNASGTATPAELAGAVQAALDSRTWTERPLRAVEGIPTCKA